MISCTSDRTPSQSDALPSLRELKSRLEGPGDYFAGADEPVLLVHLQCMTVPLEADLHKAWSLLGDEGLSASIVDQWRRNGLLLGTLSGDQMREFIQAIGLFSRLQTRTISRSTCFSPQPFSPPICGRFILQLAGHDAKVTKVMLRGGRMQFLVRLGHNEDDADIVEIVPHHYVRQATLHIRSPLETALDGRIFEDFKWTAPLEPDIFYVIGLYLAPVAAPDTTIQQTEQTPSPPDTPADPVIEVPPHLGRLLVTSRRKGQAMQKIILIGVNQ